ncbi:hypothetical protein AAHA92_09168 [Salvia divinorum]|uniref:CCHC-type domain-containing protein n=1 Tax=Salvia divinorum TaxID=28513 RepID=A0ABD1HT77_SALDI
MGDKEKGLIVALDELMPHAEKRFCVCKVAKDGTKIVENTGQVKGNCSKCGGRGHNKRTCGRQDSQASQGNVREDRSEVYVSMIMRRSKLVVRRKSANTSQEHQDISSQSSNVEN